MTRREIAPFILAGVAMGALLIASFVVRVEPEDAAEHATVRLAIPSNGAAFWPNYVAARKGFYADEKLDVRQQQIDPNITASSLIGGAVDIAYADSTQLIYAVQKKADLVAVGLSTDRHPYRLMADVPSLTALKGHKIGAVSEIDVYTYVIRVMLQKAGVDPDHDVTWIYGGNQTRRLAAMTGGLLDAGLFSPPADSRLKRMGYHGLAFAPDYFPHLTLSTETVRGDWAKTHGDTLRRLLRAQKRALDWLYDPANKAEAMTIIESFTGAKPADAEDTYRYFVAAHAWQDGCVHREGLENVVTIMRTLKQLPTITEAEVPKFANRSWCPAA